MTLLSILISLIHPFWIKVFIYFLRSSTSVSAVHLSLRARKWDIVSPHREEGVCHQLAERGELVPVSPPVLPAWAWAAGGGAHCGFIYICTVAVCGWSLVCAVPVLACRRWVWVRRGGQCCGERWGGQASREESCWQWAYQHQEKEIAKPRAASG